MLYHKSIIRDVIIAHLKKHDWHQEGNCFYKTLRQINVGEDSVSIFDEDKRFLISIEFTEDNPLYSYFVEH